MSDVNLESCSIPTLLDLAGVTLDAPSLKLSPLILIDMQNEYVDGALPLPQVNDALYCASQLLNVARSIGQTVIHIVHEGSNGGAFDLKANRGQIIDAVSPLPNELVIRKKLPNAFSGTILGKTLADLNSRSFVTCGFMTHMCVSSTVRAAADASLMSTVVSDACATRALPCQVSGNTLDAETVHRVALGEMADRFAFVKTGSQVLQAI